MLLPMRCGGQCDWIGMRVVDKLRSIPHAKHYFFDAKHLPISLQCLVAGQSLFPGPPQISPTKSHTTLHSLLELTQHRPVRAYHMKVPPILYPAPAPQPTGPASPRPVTPGGQPCQSLRPVLPGPFRPCRPGRPAPHTAPSGDPPRTDTREPHEHPKAYGLLL
jgi:hypothetical protein